MSTRLQRFWRKLGPGMITGASDDDPSAMATYADAGARFGPQLLWTALVTMPLMVAVQEMCARIGLVTRTGLMGNIRRHYPRWLTVVILAVSFPAIAFTIGADIAAMGAATHLLLPAVPDFAASALIAVGLTTALIIWDYHRIAQVLKWLCQALFAYLLIPIVTATDWGAALRHTLLAEPRAAVDRHRLWPYRSSAHRGAAAPVQPTGHHGRAREQPPCQRAGLCSAGHHGRGCCGLRGAPVALRPPPLCPPASLCSTPPGS